MAIQSHPLLLVWLRRTAAAASVAVLVIGGLVLAGWAFNLAFLRSVLPGGISTKPNTAVALMLAGVALWCLRLEPSASPRPWMRRVAFVFSGFVALLGLVTLCEYMFGWDMGIDHLLFRQSAAALTTAFPGRMAPNSALNLLLLGTALLMIDVEIRRRFRPAQFFTVTGALVALVGILGYLYGAQSLAGFGPYPGMAFPSAVGFLALALGILFARPERGMMAIFNSKSAGGSMARRLLPAALLIPAALGGVRMWGRKLGWLTEVETEVAFLMVATMFVFGVFIWLNAQWLYRADIKRRQVEEAFHQERDLMNTLMDNIPDHIYFKDRQSRFLRINKAMTALFNLTDPAQAVGKSDFDFFTAEHAKQAFADEQRIMETGQATHGQEERETWPDGSITWVSSSKVCLRDDQGQVIGTFGISRDITARKVAEEKLFQHAEELRRKNEQIEEELKMARELQLALLPQEFPNFPQNALPRESALRFFSFYHPTGSVSGDYFDVFPLSDSAVGMFICDVMGHGVRAALVTAMMHAFVQDFNALAGDPGELLTEINKGLTGILKQTGTTMYATAFYLVADVARGRLLYANAGHPCPLHLHPPAGQVEPIYTNGSTGPALGLFKDATYQTCERTMTKGDVLLLFTDGLFEVEGRNDEQYTQEKLLAAVRRRVQQAPAELVNGILAEVKEFSVRKDFDDDVCLISAEVNRLFDNKRAISSN